MSHVVASAGVHCFRADPPAGQWAALTAARGIIGRAYQARVPELHNGMGARRTRLTAHLPIGRP